MSSVEAVQAARRAFNESRDPRDTHEVSCDSCDVLTVGSERCCAGLASIHAMSYPTHTTVIRELACLLEDTAIVRDRSMISGRGAE